MSEQGKAQSRLLEKLEYSTNRAKVLKNQVRNMAILLIECRDALPAIPMASARLHHIRLDLADRIEKELEPWKISDEEGK